MLHRYCVMSILLLHAVFTYIFEIYLHWKVASVFLMAMFNYRDIFLLGEFVNKECTFSLFFSSEAVSVSVFWKADPL